MHFNLHVIAQSIFRWGNFKKRETIRTGFSYIFLFLSMALLCISLNIPQSFAQSGDSSETLEAAPSAPIPSVFIPDVTDADEYARTLIAAIRSTGKPVEKIVMYWVSPDPHPNPQVEAVIRLLHLAFHEDGHGGRSRQVIEAIHVEPELYQWLVELEAHDVEDGFKRRLRFVRDALEDEPEAVRHELLGTTPDQDDKNVHGFVVSAKQRLLQGLKNTKTRTLHGLGVPNGPKTFRSFLTKKVSLQKRIISSLSAAIQLSLVCWVTEKTLHASMGNQVYTVMAAAGIITAFFGYYNEASLAHRSQGVDFNSSELRVTQPRELDGLEEARAQLGLPQPPLKEVVMSGSGVGPSRSWMIFSSFAIHSVPVRTIISAAGLGLEAFNPARLFRTIETSGKGTLTKSIWEKIIVKMRLREMHRDNELALQGKRRSRLDWLAPSFLANTGFSIFNSMLQILDQFDAGRFIRFGAFASIMPALEDLSLGGLVRWGLLTVSIAGMTREMFWVERNRTITKYNRFMRSLRGQSPNEGCEAALLVKFQE